MIKTCFKCHQEKDISEFYVHPQMRDGHLGKCKECAKKDTIENRVAKREYYSAYEASRNKTYHRKEKRAEQERNYRATHNDRYSAHRKVRMAVRSGLLAPMPCEICGGTKVQAHHDDYSKPLSVRWLCFVHHREAHGHIVINDNNVPCYVATVHF